MILLVPLNYAVHVMPCQIALIDNQFSWSSFQENIEPRHLFDAFIFIYFLPELMRLIEVFCWVAQPNIFLLM